MKVMLVESIPMRALRGGKYAIQPSSSQNRVQAKTVFTVANVAQLVTSQVTQLVLHVSGKLEVEILQSSLLGR